MDRRNFIEKLFESTVGGTVGLGIGLGGGALWTGLLAEAAAKGKSDDPRALVLTFESSQMPPRRADSTWATSKDYNTLIRSYQDSGRLLHVRSEQLGSQTEVWYIFRNLEVLEAFYEQLGKAATRTKVTVRIV